MPGLARTSPVARGGDRRDRVGVGAGVALGVGVGARGLAEHVVGVGVALGLERPARAPSRTAMVSPSTNCWPISFIAWPTAVRTTGSPSRRTRPRSAAAGRDGVVVEHAAGQHQAPGRGVDEARRGLAEMRAPVRRLDLVGDQLVDGLGVGHAQQRLGEAHQRRRPRRSRGRIRRGTPPSPIGDERSRTSRTRSAASATIAWRSRGAEPRAGEERAHQRGLVGVGERADRGSGVVRSGWCVHAGDHSSKRGEF